MALAWNEAGLSSALEHGVSLDEVATVTCDLPRREIFVTDRVGTYEIVSPATGRLLRLLISHQSEPAIDVVIYVWPPAECGDVA